MDTVDYQTMPVKDFMIKYIQGSRPCYLPGYATKWPAFSKWQNSSYLVEKAGDQVIYSERAPLTTNNFAYYLKKFKKIYLTYREFVALIHDPNKQFNYYFAAEETPAPLKEDIVAPHYATSNLRTTDKAFWHGFGTVSLAHTDGDENFMCIIKGYKNFTIASPF